MRIVCISSTNKELNNINTHGTTTKIIEDKQEKKCNIAESSLMMVYINRNMLEHLL